MYIPTEYLSPDDFEKFANKIVSKRFKKHIIDFGEGPDGGIDGMDDSVNPTIIVQSKRYQPNTTPQSFLNLVKKEITKLEKTSRVKKFSADIDYVIVTSVKLNPNTRNGIRKLKSQWIKSDKHIIDANELLSLSSNSDYKDIFREYDLINGRLIDAVKKINYEQIELENFDFISPFDCNFIVETELMKKAYKCLRENRIVFLVGHPGVGKSISSQYLALLSTKWEDRPAKVIYRSIEETPDIINLFNTTFSDGKQSLVVIFDDFLGRNTLDAKEQDFKYVRRIASAVKQSENLYVIFNSRVEILNQGTNEHIEFGKFIESNDNNRVTVNISELSNSDKAWILRKNFEKLFYEAKGIEKQNIESNYNKILETKYYRQIVEHKNYNPRMIEFIVREARVLKKDFVVGIGLMLENPKKIYDEIYRKLNTNEQLFLYSFASFGEYPKALDEVELLFKSVVPHFGTIDDVYDILDGSWIRRMYVDDEQKIDFLNPSLYDYLRSRLENDARSIDVIIKNSPYLKNIQNLDYGKFTSFISNDDWKDKYLDYNQFIGNRLWIIIKEDGSTDEFESLIFKFGGSFLAENNGNIVEYNWIDILNELYHSDKNNLRSTFAHKIIFSKDNQKLFNLIIENVDIIELIEIINLILVDVYNGEGLERNELIDFGEEKTGFNLFSELLSCLENKISEELNDSFEISYLIEEYFKKEENDPYDLVYDDDGVSWGDSNLSVLEEVIEDYLNSFVLVSDAFLEEIDKAFIIQNIEDNFYIELGDYIADITPLIDSSREGESWFKHNESNFDDIDEILNRPLSHE